MLWFVPARSVPVSQRRGTFGKDAVEWQRQGLHTRLLVTLRTVARVAQLTVCT